MKRDIAGQSAVEFAVSVSVLIALVLSIPILAKIANANIMSIQALDYATWRVREGNTNNQELSREVSDRYFGETALVVDDEQINDQGAKLGIGKGNQQIYQNDAVTIAYTPNNSTDSWDAIDNLYELRLYEKKGTVSINLPLENLNVIPEIVDSMTISKSIYIDNQALTARDKQDINENMKDFDSILVLPYNNNLQKNTNSAYNLVISTVSATLGSINDVFEDYKIEEVEINHDAVPADRLATFNP